MAVKGKKRKYIRLRRLHNRILSVMLGCMVVLFLVVNLAVKDRSYSENENRNLAGWPHFSVKELTDGSFFSGITDYVSDQFVGRDACISLNLAVSRLLGEKEADDTYIGKAGYLLADPVTPDQEALAQTTEAINEFAREHSDLNHYMMVVPAAADILTQYLPANAPARDQIGDIRTFYEGLDDSVTCLDVSSVLQQHAGEYIYYKTDHHWTSLGASYVFQEAASAMNIKNPVENYTIYTVADDFQGTLASGTGSHRSRDQVQIYVPETDVQYYVNYADSGKLVASMYSSEALESKDKYTVFFGGNHPLTEVRTTADTGRSLLLLKDSYANSFVQFLTPYYDRIVLVDPRYFYDDLETVLNTYQITDVLYLYSGNTLMTDTSLTDVLN